MEDCKIEGMKMVGIIDLLVNRDTIETVIEDQPLKNELTSRKRVT